MYWSSIAVATTFTWLGMVLAISFIEAPLKFRAPKVTLQIGLGVGRLVFRALNSAEVTLTLILLVALVMSRPPMFAVAALGVAVAMLVTQIAGVRPFLTKRSDAVLADPDGGVGLKRSKAHFAYSGLEIIKVSALVVGGFALLAGWS